MVDISIQSINLQKFFNYITRNKSNFILYAPENILSKVIKETAILRINKHLPFSKDTPPSICKGNKVKYLTPPFFMLDSPPWSIRVK